MKPVYSRHPWDPKQLSWLQRCPYFRDSFIHKSIAMGPQPTVLIIEVSTKAGFTEDHCKTLSCCNDIKTSVRLLNKCIIHSVTHPKKAKSTKQSEMAKFCQFTIHEMQFGVPWGVNHVVKVPVNLVITSGPQADYMNTQCKTMRSLCVLLLMHM